MRAGHRASTTRLITQAETALTADPVNPVDLQLLVSNLGRKLGVLAPLYEEILELTAGDALTEEIDHADQYQENVQRVLAKLNQALHPVHAPTPRTDPTPRVDPTPVVPTTGTPITVDPPVGGRDTLGTHPATPTHGNKVKLPKLTLPHFNGNPVRWTAFWDLYDSAIHSNDKLSEVDKRFSPRPHPTPT